MRSLKNKTRSELKSAGAVFVVGFISATAVLANIGDNHRVPKILPHPTVRCEPHRPHEIKPGEHARDHSPVHVPPAPAKKTQNLCR